MSDGQSDFNAVNQIGYKLEEAAYQLRDAIKAAVEGYRGLTVNVTDTVNAILGESCPYEIRRKPERWR